ncbi:MAG TPA: RNA pyrophosphohydrolase [Pedomonas sp.]|uniref:RNA pyrophosphohydrolase n=1 Tax=Pedomonas sp. TaxID=2976421 RepID=UPI002F4068DB
MSVDPTTLPYRPCVGVTLFNRDGLVFVARRIDTEMEAWQMPQGGIDEGEDPAVTALRELEEEIGTNKAEIIAESSGWLTYDLPPELVGKVWKGRYRGQTQKWFAMRFLGEDNDINLETAHPEFCAWRWERLERLPNLIVPFKRKLYQDIVSEFAHLAKPQP